MAWRGEARHGEARHGRRGNWQPLYFREKQMVSKTTTLPLAVLVEDMDLYPRHHVDGTHVQGLVMALETGADLPKIVADEKSKRITDGWHRRRALVRFLGPEASVEVELVRYKNDAEMKLDAVHRNTAHGRRLDSVDRTRCVIMLRAAGFDDSDIGTALRLPRTRVEKLAIKVATGPKGAPRVAPGTSTISLKQSVVHLAGKKLTKKQAEVHSMLPGTSFLLLVRQLCAALKENMVDLSHEPMVEQLGTLRDLLNEKI